MSNRKKCYRNNTKRGGIEGLKVDTSFGNASNKNTTKKNYPKNALNEADGRKMVVR